MTAPTLPAAVTVADLLALTPWSIPALGALINAAPRPCVDNTHIFDAAADAETDGHHTSTAIQTARRICNSCPVQTACAARAMAPAGDTPFAPIGMYGGLTGPQRQQLATHLPEHLTAVTAQCAREGCPEPLPAGRHRYHTDECALQARRARERARSRTREKTRGPRRHRRTASQ